MTEDNKNHARLINVVALALLFLVISSFGTGVQGMCCEGDANCSNDENFNLSLKEAHLKSVTDIIKADHKAREEARQNAVESNDNNKLLGGIGDKYCFKLYEDILGTLSSMLSSPYNYIVGLIKSAIMSILNGICSGITTIVNNALNSICIPLPSLSLPNFSISGPSAKYCNGLSPASFAYIRRMPLPPSMVRLPMLRKIR